MYFTDRVTVQRFRPGADDELGQPQRTAMADITLYCRARPRREASWNSVRTKTDSESNSTIEGYAIALPSGTTKDREIGEDDLVSSLVVQGQEWLKPSDKMDANSDPLKLKVRSIVNFRLYEEMFCEVVT